APFSVTGSVMMLWHSVVLLRRLCERFPMLACTGVWGGGPSRRVLDSWTLWGSAARHASALTTNAMSYASGFAARLPRSWEVDEVSTSQICSPHDSPMNYRMIHTRALSGSLAFASMSEAR